MGADKDMQRRIETRSSRRFERVQSEGRVLGRNGLVATLIRCVSSQGITIIPFMDTVRKTQGPVLSGLFINPRTGLRAPVWIDELTSKGVDFDLF